MSLKLDKAFFEQLILKADESPRKRSHYNLHQDLNEPVQRLAIALKKGTYVRPHHHPKSNKWELMLALSGSVMYVVFNDAGTILEKLTLSPGETLSGIETRPNTWHTVYPLTDHAIILEVKEGPYTPSAKSDFAHWAPEEGSEHSAEFQTWLSSALPGEQYAQTVTL
ncbi:WbuC family cupin fold metalloprotein [Pseudoalteromonas sp. OOF1S-7]|uniref:WbuC family cupin fold metalloprotein n=1 Tax=Pseudoalteromonas sp. OOF1S-7 TaxID=2917757 RepID=UPI001EF548D4|nr:WbuC family cupin fold metalloprotein [Pseudoalteromonas sp. OOF1S-7]MCG7536531.1 WbuC family cupin fold metalloprotein [Pseudoalteromonas sp. OOF1S-7]